MYYLTSGRIPGDDEDTSYIFKAEDMATAEVMFIREIQAESNSTEIPFVTLVASSKTPIYLHFTGN